MPYSSTYGKKVYPFQSEELSPEEQAGVPMLTNIPQTAETATGRGQDVYFLSDRPETEQFLAERTPGRPYKQVLRDVHAKPFIDEDQLLDAMQKGKKFLGFNPMEPPNPGQVAQEAYQKYFDRVSRTQYENWPDNIKQMHVKAAQAEEKKAYDRAIKDVANAHQYLTSHASEWDKQKKLAGGPEPAKKALSPVDLQTSYPELTPEEAGTAAQAWNAGKTDIYNKLVRGKKITSKGKETREVKRGEEIITEERDLATGEWKEISRAPREIKTPSFKDKKLEELWGRLDDKSQLKILGGLPTDRELTDANVLSALSNMMVDPQIKKELTPAAHKLIENYMSKRFTTGEQKTIQILPEGAERIGTRNGKPLYKTPEGRKFVME